MSPIQNFFTRARHWQVFAVLVGLACVTEVVEIATYPSGDRVEIPIASLIAAEFFYICIGIDPSLRFRMTRLA